MVHALIEILEVEESEAVVRDQFHRVFAALLIYVGSCIGVKPPPAPDSAAATAALGSSAGGQAKNAAPSSKEKKAVSKAYASIKPSV